MILRFQNMLFTIVLLIKHKRQKIKKIPHTIKKIQQDKIYQKIPRRIIRRSKLIKRLKREEDESKFGKCGRK